MKRNRVCIFRWEAVPDRISLTMMGKESNESTDDTNKGGINESAKAVCENTHPILEQRFQFSPTLEIIHLYAAWYH